MSSVHKTTGSRPRGAPPRDRRLTREAVLARAEQLIDRDGVTGFSLRALARDLDVRPAALYNHVAGRDELLDAVTERFITGFVLPAIGDRPWVDWVRRVATDMLTHLADRPHRGQLMISRAPDSRAGPALQAEFLAALLGAGLPHADAHLAWHAVYTVVVGSLAQRVARGIDPGETFGAVLDLALDGMVGEVARGTSERSRALLAAHAFALPPERRSDP